MSHYKNTMKSFRCLLTAILACCFAANVASGQVSIGEQNFFEASGEDPGGNDLELPTIIVPPVLIQLPISRPVVVGNRSSPAETDQFETSGWNTEISHQLLLSEAFENSTDEQATDALSLRPQWGEAVFRFGGDVMEDHRNFYSAKNLQLLAGAYAIGAVTANSTVDESMRDFLRVNLVYTPSDEYAEFLHGNKFLGDGTFLLPAYLSLAVLGKGLLDDPNAYVIGEWGERNIRGILVGAPVLLFTQNLVGASRPGETGHASDWRPFQDDNGVSGHAFMGAIPLLTAAKMSKNKWAKAGFYTASLLPGLSRITDDAHYPSQVFLGWSLAYVATSAVAETESSSGQFSFTPMLIGSDMGVGVTLRR